MSPEPLASAFARFVGAARSATFPSEARRRAVDAMTDCAGCQLAGTAEPLAAMVLAIVPSVSEPTGTCVAPLVGTGLLSTPAEAALFGGAVAHALDYDDTNHPAYAHPSAVILPAMLGVAPLVRATGADLVSAYIVGLEMFGKLGRTLNTAHYERGWHATGTFGALAATISACCVMALAADETERALAIAASNANGVRANFGTMVKPLHAGQAARTGVVAALLARQGFTAAKDALEHRFGYLSVFAGARAPEPDMLARPGDPLEIMTEYGLALKPYPACGATHPGIEAALLLRDRIGGRAIRRVRAGVSEFASKPLIHDRPTTPLEAKFSLQFCLAAALLDGHVSLSTFTPEKLADARIMGLVERVVMEVDHRVRHNPEFGTAVRLEFEDGTTMEELVPLARGKPERWFGEAEIASKFFDCAGRAVGPGQADRIYRLLRALDGDVPATRIAAALGGRDVS